MILNFKDLLHETDWPITLTQEQRAELLRQKIHRARLYQQRLHGKVVELDSTNTEHGKFKKNSQHC